MASELRIVLTAERPEALIDETVALLAGLERHWSRFIADSDISRLNRAGGAPVVVDPSTITLCTTMIDAWQRTGGRFDPTVLPTVLAAGYVASIDDPHLVTVLPSGDFVVGGYDDHLGSNVGELAIDRIALSVSLPRRLALDPGGIGKGLAADLAVDNLLSLGASGALVSIGGDIAMRGAPPSDAGWIIDVEHPLHAPSIICVLSIDGGGVATSSTRSRRWTHQGRERHHVMDPSLRAESTTDLASVTVIAGSGWLAEVHATAALLEGADRVLDYLDAAELSGVAVTTSGDLRATADLHSILGATA